MKNIKFFLRLDEIFLRLYFEMFFFFFTFQMLIFKHNCSPRSFLSLLAGLKTLLQMNQANAHAQHKTILQTSSQYLHKCLSSYFFFFLYVLMGRVPTIHHRQPLPHALTKKQFFLLFMPNTQVILIGFPVLCPFSINKFLIIFLCYVDFVCLPTQPDPFKNMRIPIRSRHANKYIFYFATCVGTVRGIGKIKMNFIIRPSNMGFFLDIINWRGCVSAHAYMSYIGASNAFYLFLGRNNCGL